MNVEIKVCCSSFKQELCEEVEHTLRNQFGAHNVKKDNGIFEHIITFSNMMDLFSGCSI